jgi:hypothetical protein
MSNGAAVLHGSPDPCRAFHSHLKYDKPADQREISRKGYSGRFAIPEQAKIMIGIIGFGNLRIIQYIDKYTFALDEEGVRYEVVYFDRNDENERKNFKGDCIAYKQNMNTYQSFWKKVGGFIGYTRFLYRTIRAKKYDKLVILTTPTAMVLLPILLTKYRKRFIYDYRDITYEGFFAYRWLVIRLMKTSRMVMISSLGFLEKLGIGYPNQSITFVMAHNCIDVAPISVETCRRGDGPIRIVFWGMVRQPEFNKKLCLLFGNDRRFDISFHGEGYGDEIRQFCEQRVIANVHFTGRYDRERVPDFACCTDIIHCIYENDEHMKHSMQVKIYDAMKFGLPILMNEGCYALSYVEKYGIAKAVKFTQHLPDEVYEWYKNLDRDAVKHGYQAMLEAVERDEAVFKFSLRHFVDAVERVEDAQCSM